MRVLVTGSQGFIGKNLCVRLSEMPGFDVLRFDRGDDLHVLSERLACADAIVHLAGENRPQDPVDFERVNADLTAALCAAIRDEGRAIPLILASSTQAALDNPYGRSKRAGEVCAEVLGASGAPVTIFRLPGVFGKWCKPNYNSVVATFCHNIAHGLPVDIRDPAAVIQLVYVDDVVEAFLAALQPMPAGLRHADVAPLYSVSLGDLAAQIRAFRHCREDLVIEPVGKGLARALYAMYVSYFTPGQFVYDVPCHADPRGVFVEMLKTVDSGQFSYFTSLPGVTRGGHYHHSKSEKFLVIKGRACFRFRHLLTDEFYEICTEGSRPQIVETAPGWSHDVSNIGEDEMVVMLWANENFDRNHPDTTASKV